MAKEQINIDRTVGIPQPARKPAPSDDELLNDIMDDFKAARDYVYTNYQGDWEDYWQCYHNIRTQRGYNGVSDDFVPETFTIVETLKANIAGGKPRFNFQPIREEQRQDTEILNNLLDFYWEQNRMTQKTLNWVQDMIVYGNGVLLCSWEGDLPRIQNIPLADFFVDPTATHMNNPDDPGYPRYAGHRYLTTKDALRKKKIVNPDNGEMEEMYKNIDDLADITEDWDKLDKEKKEMFLGSTLGKDAAKHQVEVICYYSGDKKVIIGNRKVVLYEGKNPYYRKATKKKTTTVIDGQEMSSTVDIPEIKPFLPYAILRNYVDASLFFAKGDVATIINRQETLNDLANQKHDNLTFVLNNMWQIDPQYKHLVDQIESVPGAVYPIPQGALHVIEKQVITNEADQEMQQIKQEMRAATAADEVVQGVSQNVGRITATEVTAQVNQAQQRFSTKLTTLETEGYAQLGRILFKMVQIFVTEPIAVRILGSQGSMWKDFDPNEYSGEYEPKVELEATTKAVKAEEGQKYLALHQIIANNPLINQKEFLQIYLQKVYDFSEEETKRLLEVQPPMPQAPAQMGAMNMAGAGGGAAPPPAGVLPGGMM